MAHAWLLTGPKASARRRWHTASHAICFTGKARRTRGASLFADDVWSRRRHDDPLRLAPEDPVFHRVAAGGHSDLMTLERTVGSTTGKLSQ